MSQSASENPAASDQEPDPFDSLSPAANECKFICCMPPDWWALFATPPLQRNEDESTHYLLLTELGDEIQPRTFLEHLWVRDYADLTWDIMRHRKRLKLIMATGETAALRARFRLQVDLLKAAGTPIELDADRAAAEWHANPRMRRNEDGLGVTEDELAAESFVVRLREIAALERFIASAENRRDKMLRQTQRYREWLVISEEPVESARGEEQPVAAAPENV